jgi:hypothetical protein
MNALTLRGAYGRRYKTIEAAMTDWYDGKDFYINELECYCSIRDAVAFRRQMYLVFIQIGNQTRCVVK